MSKLEMIQELAFDHECIKCILRLEVALAMNKLSLIPNHCPNGKEQQTDRTDKMLCQELEDYTGREFYEACDRYTQTLLSSCQWYITTNPSNLTLVIACPDMIVNWRVLKNVVQIGSCLETLSPTAVICIYPPSGMGTKISIRVDELSVYRDSPASDIDSFFPL